MPTSQLLDTDVAASAKAWYTKGVEFACQGNYTEAIESLDQALQLNPDDADAYGHRCVARHRLGDHQGAIADCHQAAMLYLEQGKLEKHQYALKMLQKLQV
jgi:Flp pilus assembly protein TadD